MTRRHIVKTLCVAGLILGLIGLACYIADTKSALPRPDRPPPMPRPDLRPAEIEALIDQLQEVGEPGVGYETTSTASEFLPLSGAMDWHCGLLFQDRQPVRSDVLARLVACGAPAVPHLLAHLDDARPTGVRIEGRGFRLLAGEYDMNWRTEAPLSEWPSLRDWSCPESEPPETIAVGDLCFVALGQIVNRSFSAVRYQPSMILMINSPVHVPLLLEAARRQWADLTEESHRASLIRDFRQPDSVFRRRSAYQRLAYYYPDVVEELVLEVLSAPTYDSLLIYHFLVDVLYKEDDHAERKRLFDEFVSAHGEATSDGILLGLFDLLVDYGDSPERKEREILAQFYGYDETVTSDQAPFVDAMSRGELAMVLEVLIYDDSPKIDQAVLALLETADDDDYLALRCFCRLIDRGYDEAIRTHCKRRLRQGSNYKKAYRDILRMLKS
ncbi:MAG: hypothetical protein ACYS8X_09900 [Planctomycetota bacterium]|jgi:hypothetical protein